MSPTPPSTAERFSRLEASHRTLPEGATRIGPVPADEPVQVSVYLKPVGEEALAAPGRVDPEQRRAALLAHRRTHQADGIAAVEAFARAHGLAVDESAAGRRLVKLSGTAAAMQAAFRTELHVGEQDRTRFRMRTGALSLPSALEPLVESVLGLDSRPAARPRFVPLKRHHAATSSHLPNQVGALYHFPTGVTGAGQTVALIELGGGYSDADNSAAFAAMGLAVPSIVSVGVDGGANTPGGDADGEVALDIQVVGGNAPGAAIAVYFAPNTDQGFADAIGQAAHDTANKPTVMSISWGGPESSWTAQAIATMNTQIEDAGTLGLSVFVASGDSLATDGVSDGHAHVDFPASSPYAFGCGGTSIAVTGTGAAASVTAESVWNDGTSGTGGGISDLFPVPGFQAEVKLPASVNRGRVGRGVPDVAGDGAPASGYVVVVDGQSQVVGGTSAVAPLWAGLTALLNQSLGRPLGFYLPSLYANPSGLVEITTGNNRPTGSALGYAAGAGWNACTGLGRPNGAALLARLQGTGAAVA